MKHDIIEELVARYSTLVFTICNRFVRDYHEAENLTQETFFALYKNRDLIELESPKAYITTIAANKCRDYLKSARMRKQSLMADEDMIYFASGEEVEREVADNALRERLTSCCEALKEPYKTVAILRFCDECSLAEIAAAQQKDVKTVATQAYRARDKLKPMLKEWLQSENI